MILDKVQKVITTWGTINKIEKPSKDVHLEIINEIASMFAVGPFYYYILNYSTLNMDYIDDGVVNILGFYPHECSAQKLMHQLHPDDLNNFWRKQEIIFNAFLDIIGIENLPYYTSQHLLRIKHKNGNYKLMLHQSKVINLSKDQKVQQQLIVQTDITHLNVAHNPNISIIGSKNRPSYNLAWNGDSYKISDKRNKNIFTKREIEIIRELAKGKNYKQISDDLHISPNTINTHKRNILKKAKCKNTPELIRKCLIQGIIIN